MQLMPATAARFGVRNIHDPAQNIGGGTRFLKQLLGRFNGRVELVLASYNAGEGAVIKYGHRVPPYRETRNYVRRITGRYGRAAHAVSERTTSTVVARN
jgi:soluble lytic murein transglycosylase-like protein